MILPASAVDNKISFFCRFHYTRFLRNLSNHRLLNCLKPCFTTLFFFWKCKTSTDSSKLMQNSKITF